MHRVSDDEEDLVPECSVRSQLSTESIHCDIDDPQSDEDFHSTSVRSSTVSTIAGNVVELPHFAGKLS